MTSFCQTAFRFAHCSLATDTVGRRTGNAIHYEDNAEPVNLGPMRDLFSRFLVAAALLTASCGSDSSPGGASPDGGGSSGTDATSLPSCDALCPAVLVPKCPQGPQSQSDCVGGCQAIRTSKCLDKYVAVYDCGGVQPVYACDGMGRTTTVGCETLMDALYTCMANM